MRRIAAVAATATLTCVFALFAGSAFAGDHGQGAGSGGGSGNEHATGSAQKAEHQSTQSSVKAHADTSQSAHASTNQSANAKAHAHAKASAQITTSVQGVKPTTATAHNTYAPAASTSTKLYGNGKTAGQIATQSGAPTATLHGPGNSQPHKLALCPAKHEVDVHALKSHHGSGCAKQQETTASEHGRSAVREHVAVSAEAKAASASSHATICHATGSATHPVVVISPSTSGVFHGHLGHQETRDVAPTFQYNGMTLSQNWNAQAQVSLSSACAAQLQATTTPTVTPVTATVQAAPATQQPAAATQQPAAATPAAAAAANTSTPAAKAAAGSGVKGVTAQAAAPKNAAGANASQNAAGVNASQSSGNNLPFTGLPLWLVVLAAGALILAGGVLRLGGRAAR